MRYLITYKFTFLNYYNNQLLAFYTEALYSRHPVVKACNFFQRNETIILCALAQIMNMEQENIFIGYGNTEVWI